MKSKLLLSLLGVWLGLQLAGAQNTAFSYQGRLSDAGLPANGPYNMTFRLFPAASGGAATGPVVTVNCVNVNSGDFIVSLDFGSAPFTGQTLWLQITAGSCLGAPPPPPVTLTPRQELAPVPYAILAGTASSAGPNAVNTAALQNNAVTAGKIASSQVVKSLNGLMDAVTLVAGANVSITPSGNSLQIAATGGGSSSWGLIGNAGTTPGVNYIGTSDGALVRLHSTGGVRIDDTTPSLSFGATRRQMLNLYNADFGFGVQDNTLYSRIGPVNNGFAWYAGGVHTNSQNEPGAGGARLMLLTSTGRLGIGTINPQRRLHVGDISTPNSEGIIRLASRTGTGAAAREWDLGVPETENDVSGTGYSFVIDDLGFSGGPEFMIKYGNGHVGIGTNNPLQALHVAGSFIRVEGQEGQAAFLGGGGSSGYMDIGSFNPGLNKIEFINRATLQLMEIYARRLDAAIDIIAGSITSRGNVVAAGTGGERAYIGGDGVANDVEVGSQNPNINNVTLWNTANGRPMSLGCASLNIAGGADLAEPFEMSSQDVPKGALVIIDEEHSGRLKLTDQAYDRRVAGIVSGANGINPGITLQQEGSLQGSHNVALSGRVYALADATDGPIKPGDLLTSSTMSGHVMRVTDHSKAQGAIVGKAMSGLKDGQGLVLVLVSLQ